MLKPKPLPFAISSLSHTRKKREREKILGENMRVP